MTDAFVRKTSCDSFLDTPLDAIWADFLAPAGPARVCPCAEVRLST
jgi:hypothetical protein